VQEAQGPRKSIPTTQPKCLSPTEEETRKAEIAFEKIKVHGEEEQSLGHADNRKAKKIHFRLDTGDEEDNVPRKKCPMAQGSIKTVFQSEHWMNTIPIAPRAQEEEDVGKDLRVGRGESGNPRSSESRSSSEPRYQGGKDLPNKGKGSKESSNKVNNYLTPQSGICRVTTEAHPPRRAHQETIRFPSLSCGRS